MTIAFTAEVASGAVVARGSDGFYALAIAPEHPSGKDRGHVHSSLQIELNSLLPHFDGPSINPHKTHTRLSHYDSECG